MRAETGPMQFGDDRRGLFIRGDSAFNFAGHLRHALEVCQEPIARGVLKGLATLLELTNEHEHPSAHVDVQRMRPFQEAATETNT